MAGKGGARPGAGRKKGVPNKATADVKALARDHAPAAVTELARLMLGAESEAARVAAIKEILDRAYGKATTMVGGDPDNPIRTILRVELAPLSGNADGKG